MRWLKNHAGAARAVAIIAFGGLALSACATQGYVDERIAAVNTRLDQVDARVQAAAQRAEAANTAAQSAAASANSANQAAQAAATDARTANQRLDQVEGRVTTLETPARRRTPRG